MQKEENLKPNIIKQTIIPIEKPKKDIKKLAKSPTKKTDFNLDFVQGKPAGNGQFRETMKVENLESKKPEEILNNHSSEIVKVKPSESKPKKQKETIKLDGEEVKEWNQRECKR